MKKNTPHRYSGLVVLLSSILLLLYVVVQSQTSQQQPYRIKTIVIDAGHGGKDPGAVGKYGKEKDILMAGDPLEVDKRGALILGHNWKKIPHLIFADELKYGKINLKKKDLR